MHTEDMEALAHRRVGARFGFYIHATVFAAVNTGLVLLNLFTDSHPWSLRPFFGWGLGLAIHGILAHGMLHEWKQRLVRAELRKLENEHARVD